MRKISKIEQCLTKPIKIEFVWLLSDKKHFRAWGDIDCKKLLSDKRFTYEDIKNIITEYKCVADEHWTNFFSFDGDMKLRKVRCNFNIGQYDSFTVNEL